MDWLYEGRFAVYGFLVFTFVAFLLVWSIGKFNHILPTTIVLTGFIASYWLLDNWVETNKEKAEILLSNISNLCKSGRIQETTKYLSEKFTTQKGTNKTDLESWLKNKQGDKFIKELIFWNLEDMKIQESEETFKISSMVKIKGNWGTYQEGIFRLEIIFENKKDRNLLIKSFQLFDPISANNQLEIGI